MKELFEAMLAALRRGENVVLCSILASSGSSPRGAGAKMAVFADGSTRGTIGGGAVERIAAGEALEVHRSGKSFRKAFCLAPNQVADIGMICGGNVTVYYQFFDAAKKENIALLEAILGQLAAGKNAWLVMQMTDGLVDEYGLYDEEHGLRFCKKLTLSELRPMMQTRAVYETGEPSRYVEPLSRAGRVYIFGGGHVGRELAPVLSHVDFRVTVFDNRESFAKPENYPAAEEVIFGSFENIGEKLTITKDDCVVVMTPGHLADRAVLLQAMRSPAYYIGCIGSRRKIAGTNAFLMENGIPEAELARIHAPIGLPILAETPAEIAISVAAEMIRCRAERSGSEQK
jgi:xanthine dehydrogenase accessory factor